ncbi:hypothetical protein H0H81_012080 [Sphagnurus paluster]|uniref:Protein kinase domain-containing protein n=1 Tax=Sphagnurus paluster TaxID=117069 RepID=A0A9P7K4U2_9AGAR|nr:hypothetical protein H0H81_012080 [Sphagnurus paluster]
MRDAMDQTLRIHVEEISDAVTAMQRFLEQLLPDGQGEQETGKKSSNYEADTERVPQIDRGFQREFLQAAIDILMHVSFDRGEFTQLPPWAITPYEVLPDGKKIKAGSFSDIYAGHWCGRVVAVKVLAPATPSKLFLEHVAAWRVLDHPNVLKLYGATSATTRPIFLICPYLQYGNLVKFLKNAAAGVTGGTMTEAEASLVGSSSGVRPRRSFTFMLEIAQGMAYLHRNNVLHGELKGEKVLMSDKLQCVVSGFGQRELKSTTYHISGAPINPPITLRWQSPEVMSGNLKLTPQMDIYSYAMACVEILTHGKMPWDKASDEIVRELVLSECD